MQPIKDNAQPNRNPNVQPNVQPSMLTILHKLRMCRQKINLLIMMSIFLVGLMNVATATTTSKADYSVKHKTTHHTHVKKKRHTKRTAHVRAMPTATDQLPSGDTSNNRHNPRLYSYSALAMDAKSGEVLISKNPNTQLPIASITKLMTAMVTLDSETDLDDYVTISSSDIDTLKNTYSRLKVGMQFRRRDLLLLALMSSENRAAHALARTSYSGGLSSFIQKMNTKAKSLGMLNTQFYDPTGLTVANQSTAEDLSKMVRAAFEYDLIRRDTTTKDADVMLSRNYVHRYINSDALVRTNKFQISLSKTGFINEAGHCLVLYSIVNTRPIIMVFLNSAGKGGRLIDALTVKNYIKQL
jgi:D-alanyl-D-alanine endopeptidase (penicillin-binding protein 7)